MGRPIVDEPPRARAAWVALGLAVAVLVVLTVIAGTADGPTAPDRSVTTWIAEHRPDALVSAMEVLTFAGSGVAIWSVAGVGIAIGLVRRDWGPLLIILPTALIASFATNVLKAGLDRPRPPAGIALHDFFASSFPSGHATTAAALWGAIAFVLVRSGRCSVRWGLVLWGSFVLVVSASRLVLGAHWLTDVIAGTAVGVACVAVSVLVTDRRPASAALPEDDGVAPAEGR